MKFLNSKALEYINAIDRYHSLRKAAIKLNVDPSAVSRSLRALEDVIGASLIERKGNASHLTSAGKELMTYYRKIQLMESEVLSKIDDYRHLRAGEIKIAIGEGFITDLISPSLQSFLSRYPAIQLSVLSAGAKEAIQLIEDEQIDFAVTYASSSHPSIECLVETLHPLDIIAPTKHPLTELKRTINVEEASHYPLALIDHSTGMGRLVLLAEEQGDFVFSPQLKTNSVAVLKSYVSSGTGISFMPKLSVKSEIEQGLIEVIETTHPILSKAKARVMAKKGRNLPPAAQALLTHLKNSTQFLRNENDKAL